ncbi:MAG: CMP-2-keto-3-deoxyoctulosonic acid synthetase [Eggerthellaceae bacterium]|nr:CMP-2-keto-3-deoxyoctulosonic acid synthetase [Eggerthellaceae bacterium]
MVLGINFNLASAGAGNTTASTLGIGRTSNVYNTTTEASEGDSFILGEYTLLTRSTNRNIDQAITEMLAREEAERIAAEEARRLAEIAKKAELEALQARSAGDAAAAGLDPVDWSMSHDEFVEHWAARIDAFMAGFPLEGQGRHFAEAAWNYGVDPRLSPAIASTESTRGKYCSVPYNAWGWGPHIPFSSWEQGIDIHVRGLKIGGYSPITYEGAQRYCPPTADSWYRETTKTMSYI